MFVELFFPFLSLDLILFFLWRKGLVVGWLGMGMVMWPVGSHGFESVAAFLVSFQVFSFGSLIVDIYLPFSHIVKTWKETMNERKKIIKIILFYVLVVGREE
ncbi:uncharacterized protein AKAW2_10734S [Aspergillus luchuensis]|uniref:Uncharacterized protein n=1 Tax=Aspergillus kawachii TaxID=1069201 RepID=A0A7R7VZL0_ASPKA|nr:uncharacterized protein AKAW2_10734S [Aspergillus luchuensis]BCR93688.1 hypothetical protein AKAW2_10734S [Aspergillus luchuensis]BCS06315.1 hypothetical protein ALUC_10696S [Aspergillus luchuensis]